MRGRLRWALPLGLALLACGSAPVRAQDATESSELYRLRVVNQAGGAVEVSTTGGQEWSPLGKVSRPATAAAAGTGVLTVAPASAVAGVTREGLTVRVPTGAAAPKSFRIGAQNDPASPGTIVTNIPAGSSLFRCVAPPTGSRVLLERAPSLEPLPANYAPRTGDRLVILVNRPADPEPPSVTIENKVNGEVLLAATGGIPRVLARVKQPLKGIGRYPGTERAGQGAVLGWSPTLALVSTSGVSRRLDPDNQPVEERGGFVIQPAEPALRGVTHPASQLLLESVADPGAKADPLDAKLAVSPFFGLPVPLTSGDPLDPKPTRVEVKIDGGDWEAFPDLRGTINEENMLKALQEALGGDRTVKTGITHLRVVYGSATPVSAQRRARLASTPRAGNSVQRGKVTITANVMGEGISYVSFFLNGTLVRITNLPPYGWEWDTLRVPNGEHLLEIRGSDGKGAILSSIVTKVLVDN